MERSLPQLIEASTLKSTVGVNVHLNFSGTAYQNVSAVETAMNYLGLNTMRDMGAQQDSSRYDALANKGFKFDFMAPGGQYQLDIGTLTSRLHKFAVDHPGAITSLEGPNEVNLWPINYNGGSGLAAAKAYQQAFFNAVSADPVLNPIPMINLSLAVDNAPAYGPLGNMSGATDLGNVHAYMSYGNQPNVQLSSLVSYAQGVTPGRGMAITESGYPTLASSPGQGVDETTQAKLTLNLVMDATKMGIAKTFLYELADNQYSGGGAWNYGGLFRSDWSAKPAAVALHNMMSTLTTSQGGTPTTSAPDYTVSGLTGYNANLTVHEANGAYDIVVWREPDIWDHNAHTQINAPAQTATIQLTQAVQGYVVYDPMVGTNPIATGGPTSQIQVQVKDHPLIIELRGGGAASPAPTPAPTPTEPAPTSPGPTGKVISGTEGGESLIGGKDADVIRGNGGTDVIWAEGGNDTLDGGAGNDWLHGQGGNDVLTGGSGQDQFIFDNPTSFGADRITDFNTKDDTIRLEADYYRAGSPGWLSSSAFYKGAAAHDASDRIIYNPTSGALMYDPDGTGAAASQVIAHLQPGLSLTNADVFLF
jgi:Ca2+-binding RTX toxin-like protein